MKNTTSRSILMVVLLCAALTGLGGCQRNSAAPAPDPNVDAKDAQDPNADKKEQGEITLTPEQIDKIGLQAAVVEGSEFADQAAGYGGVIPHDSIAQGVAELVSAQATQRQSQSALARTRRLSGTAGALSADTEEASARQAEVDAAAATLARQRLSAMFGLKPPWSGGGNLTLLRGLADGNPKLVRVTFPLGALPGDTPKVLYAAHIGAAPGERWKMTTIWAAPADANVPGRSFFAILAGADVGEGERILVWAPLGAREAGVVIPQAAVVLKDGKYWCYLEATAGRFVRTEIDAHRPFEGGYFLSEGVKSGDQVVMKGAAQLLAQESNSGGDTD